MHNFDINFILRINNNNYKYNLFIKLFCSVIDKMIKDGILIISLNNNGKNIEYNKYINNKITEREKELNNTIYYKKK